MLVYVFVVFRFQNQTTVYLNQFVSLFEHSLLKQFFHKLSIHCLNNLFYKLSIHCLNNLFYKLNIHCSINLFWRQTIVFALSWLSRVFQDPICDKVCLQEWSLLDRLAPTPAHGRVDVGMSSLRMTIADRLIFSTLHCAHDCHQSRLKIR